MRHPLTLPVLVAGLALCSTASAQTYLVNQPPIAGAPYTVARVMDNIEVTDPAGSDITEVTYWGAYVGTGAPSIPDAFNISFWDDAGGLPGFTGPAVYVAGAVPGTPTGLTCSSGETIYKYVYTLPAPLHLAPGVYWIEVQDTPWIPNGDVWRWCAAAPSSNPNIFGFAAWVLGTWYPQSTNELALRVETSSAGLTMSLAGSCPGGAVLQFTGATPNAVVHVGWSPQQGNWTVPVTSCAGTLLNISSPSLAFSAVTDAGGNLNKSVNLPAGACGVVHVQALDAASCETSSVLSL